MSVKTKKVGIIGCGVMGSALITAVAKVVPGKNIILFDADGAKSAALAEKLGATVAEDCTKAAAAADYLIVAVKPNVISSVISDITTLVPENELPLFVSIAAGVDIARLKKLALIEARFIRLMPNLPATVGEAMIALTCGDDIKEKEVADVKEMLSKAGAVEQVPESLMDCVTGVSGSGPAFGFMFIEALADAAVKLGMPRKQAYIYAAQTLKGAATMVLETGDHPAALKDAVCSPNGTTIAGVAALEECGFRNAVIKAAVAATDRSAELGGRK